MKLSRAQRLLLVAFAISLLAHAIVALWLRPSTGTRENDIEVVTLVHRPVAMTKLQTPPPRPKVTPVPHPAPSVRPAPRATHGVKPAKTGTGTTGAATAAPTPVPTAASTPAADACSKSDLGAAVTETPAPPDIPLATRASGTSGIALIKVQLDAQGAVTQADVSQSTGNSSLDLVAVSMARAAQYSPALHDCKPIASDYTFSVKFVAW